MFRGPTKYSEYLQDVPKSIDFILKRVNAVTVADLQAVTNAGATTTLPITTGGITADYLQLKTAATPTLAVGMTRWNNSLGVPETRLGGGNVTGQHFLEGFVVAINKTGATLNESEFRVVRIRSVAEGGAQGQRLAVVLAQADSDANSATTIGIVTETVPNNQQGLFTTTGDVNEINTTGAMSWGGSETWVDGDILYLSPDHAGYLTKVKPIAPKHMIVVGWVVYAHAVHGKIFVKVDNGYELDELHNVRITSVANNDLLQYDSTLQVWKNVAPSIAVPTPTLAQVTTAGNTTTNGIVLGSATVITASPYTLQVVGGAGGSAIFSNSAKTQGLNINLTTAGETRIYGDYFGAGVDQKLILGTFANRATQLVLQTSGNVGINTTTDTGYKLDVNGTARIQGVLTSTANINGLTVSNNNNNPVIGSDGTNVLIGSNQAYRIVFSSNRIDFKVSDGTNSVNAGSFTSSGSLYVGGNASTTAKLQVSGSVTASTALAQGVFFNNTLVAAANNDVLVGLDINPTFANGAFTGVQNYSLRALGSLGSDGTNVYSGYVARIQNTKDYDTTNGVLLLVNQNGGAGGHFIKAVNAQAGQVRFLVDGNGSLTSIGNGTFTGDVRATKIRWNTDGDGWIGDGGLDGTFVVNTNNTERYRVTPNGNLLLNTTTDAGYKLDVNGNTRTTGSLSVGSSYGTFLAGASTDWAYTITGGESAVIAAANIQGSTRTIYGVTIPAQSANLVLGTSYGYDWGMSFNIISTGKLGIKVNKSTDAALIFANGNWAIGTTTDAGYKLDVNGTARVGSLGLYGNNGTTTASLIKFNGSNQVNVDPQGYGIVTNHFLTTANYIFASAGGIRANGGFGAKSGTSVVSTPFMSYGISRPDADAQINALAGMGGVHDGASGWYQGLGLVFYTSNGPDISGGGYLTEKMRLSSVGNLGIGTTGPATKLDITGAHVSSIGLLRLNSTAGNISAQTYYIDGSYKAAIYAGTDNNFFLWGRAGDILLTTTTSNTERMRITSGGNVLINTTTDTGEKLQVNGSIKSSALTLNGPVLATGGVLSSIAGYTGLFTVPTNPPGQQTLDIQNGIIVNVL